MIPCYVSHILIEEQSDCQVVFLKEHQGERQLPIVIGQFEIRAIERAAKKQQFARPLTHDLLKQVIEHSDYNCQAIHIAREDQGTYFAELILDKDAQSIRIDCRPSDAIALLLRIDHCELFIAEHLLNDPNED